MNRRRFVQAGVTSLLIPATAIAGRSETSGDGLSSDRFFFDERFAEARRLAPELSGLTIPTAVQADVTPVWAGSLARASLAAPLTLKGVTTESFYFCLTVLLRDRVPVDAQVARHDRDLHLWTIRTGHSTSSPSWDRPPATAFKSWQHHFRRV